MISDGLIIFALVGIVLLIDIVRLYKVILGTGTFGFHIIFIGYQLFAYRLYGWLGRTGAKVKIGPNVVQVGRRMLPKACMRNI